MYSAEDYLLKKEFYFENIGILKSPCIKDIVAPYYTSFVLCQNILLISKEDYVKAILEKNSSITVTGEETLYELLLTYDMTVCVLMLSYFIPYEYKFDSKTMSFIANNENGEVTTVINNSNFEDFRANCRLILDMKITKDVESKCKNEKARQILAKLNKVKEKEKEKEAQNKNYTLENMILKFCTYNTCGINIFNVNDLTYYQFLKLFRELPQKMQIGRSDLVYGNSFSFDSSSDYKTDLWIEEIKTNEIY